MKGAVGVILVYNPDDQEHLGQLQYWHDKMIRPMKLNDEQVIVFQHRPQATFLPPKERKGTDCAHGGLPFRALQYSDFRPHCLAQRGCCVHTTRARRR